MPPILVFPTSTIATGTALEQYRESILRRMGPFYRTSVSTKATGLEARRYVICTGFRSDTAPMSQFDNLYLYVRSGDQAGEQRMLISGGYDGPDGAAVVDYPFDDPLEATTEIEIAVLPALDYLGVTGATPIVNDALQSQWLRDRLTFTGDGTYSYSLQTYPWLLSTNQIIGLVDSLGVPTGGNPTLAATPWRIRYNGDTRYLETDTPYSTGTEFQIETYRPANTLIKTGGIWGSGDGLVNESDEAVPPLYLVKTIGLAFAYQQMLARSEWDERLKPSAARFEREYTRWGRAAAQLKWEDLPHESAPYPLVSGGTRYLGDKGLWSSWS
jgi:hypothetical protein